MQKVKFIADLAFSPDGINVVRYKAGQEYEVSQVCYNIAVEVGAVAVESNNQKSPAKNKMLRRAPKNKSE